MPIRIRCRDRPRDRAQPTEDKGINATLAAIPMACYTDRKPELRILCGSVQSLLCDFGSIPTALRRMSHGLRCMEGRADGCFPD